MEIAWDAAEKIPPCFSTEKGVYLQAGEEVRQLDEQRQQDESDEAGLWRRLGHFVSVHERSDGETL